MNKIDEGLKITFLGTGTSQGVPVIGSDHPVCLSDDPRDKRLRVSVMLSWDHYNFVIDCGPDFRQQMLTHNVRKLDGILFTHEHADHTAGMDDIRPYFFRQGAVPLYANQRVETALKERFRYIFDTHDRYPGAPEVAITRIEKNVPFSIGDKEAYPIEAWHHRLPVLGFRVDDFVYLTDVKKIEPDQLDKIKGVNTLVINALRIKEHPSHLNLDEALELVSTLEVERVFFTHISHLLGFHEEVEKQLPEGVHLAHDNLVITV